MPLTMSFTIRVAILCIAVILVTAVKDDGENTTQLEGNSHTLKRATRAVHIDIFKNPNNDDNENKEIEDKKTENENRRSERPGDSGKDNDDNDDDDEDGENADGEEMDRAHPRDSDRVDNPKDGNPVDKEDKDEYEDKDEDAKISKSLHDSIEKIAREVVDELRKRWEKQHKHKKGSSHFKKHHDSKSDDNKIEIIKDDEEHQQHDTIGNKNEAKQSRNEKTGGITKQTKTPNDRAVKMKKNDKNGKNTVKTGLVNDKKKLSETFEEPAKKISFIQNIHYQPNSKYKVEANKVDNEQVARVEYAPDDIKTAKSDSEAKNVLYKALSVETNNSSSINDTSQNDGEDERVFGLNQFQFVILIVACCVTIIATSIVAFICWYKLETNMKQRKGKRGSFKATPNEKNLAEGAEVFHYMTIKKVLQELEPKNSPDKVKCMDEVETSDTSDVPESSDNDEVLSCAGLVIPDDLNVANPMFGDSEVFCSDPVSSDGSSNPSATDMDEFLSEKEDEIEEVEKEIIVVDNTINETDLQISEKPEGSIDAEEVQMGKESVNYTEADINKKESQIGSESTKVIENSMNVKESLMSTDAANNAELDINTENAKVDQENLVIEE